MLAGELLEGRYSESFYHDAPIHARYPPGYPLWLALVRWVTGPSENAYVAVNIAIGCATTLLLLAWARRSLPGLAWLFFGTAVVLNPESILLTGTALSEPLFGFLTVLGLCFDEGRRSTSRGVVATLAFAATSVVRTAGLAICGGMIAAWLVQRRWVAASVLALVTATTGGAWMVFALTRMDADVTYSDTFQATGMTDVAGALHRITVGFPGKVRSVAVDQVPTALGFPAVPGTWFDNLFGALLLAVLLPAGLYYFWRRWPAAAWVLLAYGALNVVWPWTLVRYVVPLTPLLLLCLFAGAVEIAERWWPGRAKGLFVGALGVYLLLGAGIRLSNELRRWAACDREDPLSGPHCFSTPGDYSFVRAARYLDETLPPGTVVFSDKSVTFYYFSGHPTLHIEDLLREDSVSLAPALRRHQVEWTVVSNAGSHRRRQGPLVATACRDFDLVRAFDSTTVVLRLRPPDAAPEWGPACEATRVWRTPAGLSGVPEPRPEGGP